MPDRVVNTSVPSPVPGWVRSVTLVPKPLAHPRLARQTSRPTPQEGATMADYTVRRIDEMEGIYGGAFKRARAELGVSSFGMQVLDLPPGLDQYPEHDHSEDRQEEVYLVLRGSARMLVDGDEIELTPDDAVRVGPGVKRKLTTGPDGARVLIIGGVPGEAYTINPATELTGANA